ncbi:MAG: SPFH domain-containing protein [Spirochaetaceae bacterium]|nr:SPFH domain-containing protein [Spirochaetaceae bacterium]
MALFQVIKYNGPANVLVWKHPKENITTGSQLVVGPTQEAVFVKGGQVCDILKPGTYTLNTKNLPILAGLVSLPFGNSSPFTAEVFFVSKQDILDIKWGTARPIQMQDPAYNVVIPLRAFGQYGVTIDDSRLFLEKSVGTAQSYTTQDLMQYFHAVVGSRIADELAGYLLRNTMSFLEAQAHLTEIAEGIASQIAPFFQSHGIRLVNFCITSINVPETDPSVQKLREVFNRKHEMETLQFSYQQERSFNVLEKAAQNLGSSGELAGVSVGMAMSNVMADMVRETLKTNATVQPTQFCGGCGTSLTADAAFCHKCGKAVKDRQLPCPKCAATCQPGDSFCTKCGQPLG